MYTDLTTMRGTGPCGLMRIIFGSIIQNWYTSLSIKFGANRTFKYTDLTIMRGTGYYGPMRIIFLCVINRWYTSPNTKFGANRTFYVPKTPVCLFNYYGTLWIDEDNFYQYYLELVYKAKHQIWCESDIPCPQDPNMPN